jgi:hypothetical protein
VEQQGRRSGKTNRAWEASQAWEREQRQEELRASLDQMLIRCGLAERVTPWQLQFLHQVLGYGAAVEVDVRADRPPQHPTRLGWLLRAAKASAVKVFGDEDGRTWWQGEWVGVPNHAAPLSPQWSLSSTTTFTEWGLGVQVYGEAAGPIVSGHLWLTVELGPVGIHLTRETPARGQARVMIGRYADGQPAYLPGGGWQGTRP